MTASVRECQSGLVAAVLLDRSKAQVDRPVIGGHAIDMVDNLFSRVLPGNEEVHNPMGHVLLAKQPNFNVAGRRTRSADTPDRMSVRSGPSPEQISSLDAQREVFQQDCQRGQWLVVSHA